MKEFTAQGRCELGGNHTDHQHGCVLAAGINLRISAYAQPNESPIVNIHSENFPEIKIKLDDLKPLKAEEGTTQALVKGVIAKASELTGKAPQGFDAVIKSDVPVGSGLSSSAAFEVLIGRIINTFFLDEKLTPIQIAQIGQYAENVYYGKPCGLMDQMASSLGGVVAIDFNNPDAPDVKKISFDFEDYGSKLYVIDTFEDHAGLTSDYEAIPKEMGMVAAELGCSFLRDADENEFRAKRDELEAKLGARPVNRAQHFFEESKRAQAEARALKNGNYTEFLRLFNESGLSSENLLGNIVSAKYPKRRGMENTINAAREFLKGQGGVRVHGGGFAGTVLAIIPVAMEEDFIKTMDKLLLVENKKTGKHPCTYLKIEG